MRRRPLLLRVASATVVAMTGGRALAQYQPPDPAYAPAAEYYDAATGVGATLKANLNSIVDGHISSSYDQARDRLQVLDADPANPNNVLLVYSGYSVPGAWDGGNTWNREHLWPDSYGIEGSGIDYGDLFNLRPADPNVNSDRGNEHYANVPLDVRQVGNLEAPQTWEDTADTMWEPRPVEKGDLARALFYMDTRYDGADTGTTDLALTDNVGGISSSNSNMGRLSDLLKWHYQDGVGNAERKRNDQIHDLYQGNRNPFVDHPEYVWAIFGGGNNNSKLYVGGSAPANGTSSTSVNLRVMRNGTWGSASVTLDKTGVNPTTYDVTATGGATTSNAGAGQTFDYDTQSRAIDVTLSAPTTATGLKSGAITIDNTDLTTGGAGLGSTDGNDTITVTGQVVDNRVITASAVDFARVIAGANVSANTTLSSPGSDGANTRVLVSGAGSTTDANGARIVALFHAGHLFNGTLTSAGRGLEASFSTPGAKAGMLAFTVQGEGLAGEAVNGVSASYSAAALDHAQSSLNAGTDVAEQTIDFGYVPSGFAARLAEFQINNRPTAAGGTMYTAGLDVDGVGSSGSALMTTDVAASGTPIAAGAGRAYVASFSPGTVAGEASAMHTILVSDENVPGAQDRPSLVLTTTGRTFTDATFPVTGFLNLLSGETLNTGPFAIEAGVTLTKSGPGTMNITGPQTNGAEATLIVSGGAVAIDSNGGENLAVHAGTGAAITFNAFQHLRDLSVNGSGKVDLKANAMIVATGDASTWNGSTYTGLAGLVRSGRSGGSWSGAGLITTAPEAINSRDLTTLAVATAGELGRDAFAGQMVQPDYVLVMYTWGGDANLDGKINVDDYGRIDGHVGQSGSVFGWSRGDFNYDGMINVDDYGIIDGNIARQGAPIMSPGGVGALVAVPEPHLMGLIALAWLGARRQRRSRREKA